MEKKLGITHWYGYCQPLTRRLERVKIAGFDGVMIFWEDDLGEEPIRRVKIPDLVRAAGLEIFSVHMPGQESDDLWSASLSRRLDYLKVVTGVITEMADQGLHLLILHLCERGDIPRPGKELLGSIEKLLRCAEDNKSQLAIENTWRDDYLDAVFQEFAVPEIGFCYDTSHGQLRTHQGLLDRWGERLIANHVADNDGQEDRHWLPYDGIIDYSDILPRLAQQPLLLEVIADKTRYGTEQEFLTAALVAGRRCQAAQAD